MSVSERIAQLEREYAEQSDLRELVVARLRGIEAELNRLRSGSSLPNGLAEGRLTDAIETVLRSATGPLSPTDLKTKLAAGGRSEQLNKITSTLSYLRSTGRVSQEGRGMYQAT